MKDFILLTSLLFKLSYTINLNNKQTKISNMALTHIRTRLQFSQYGTVKTIIFYGNKLLAMNTIKSVFGVKSFSILHEYKTDGFLPEGYYTQIN